MNEILIEKVNQVYVRVRCHLDQELELKSFLSCHVPNYMYHPKFRAKIWDGKVSFFNMQNKLLPVGLLPDFHRFCKQFGYKYRFDFDTSELCNDVTIEQVESFANGLMENTRYDPYDYQIEAVTNSIRNKRGVILSPTGSGKSLTIYMTIRLLLAQDPDRKIILIVPTTSLVEQMYSDFQDYGWLNIDYKVTKLYSGLKPDFRKSVLITTWQSIHRKQKIFFQKYGVLMVDETHQAKALSIQSISKKCTEAEYRFGYTGTLPTNRSDLFNIHGYLGPVIFKQISKELIDRGILSKIKIVNVLLKFPESVIQKNRNRPYNEEEDTIINHVGRNKIFDLIFNNIPDGQNSLVLCRKIEHLKMIQEHLEHVLPDKYMIVNIYGKTKPEEREAIRHLMEKESNMILVGTYATMSTGVNIRKMHNVFFASSYKSKIKVLQAIGRGLRTHSSKEKVIIWDFVDDLTWKKRTGNIGHNHTYKHYLERLKYYEEQGFTFYNRKFQI